MNVMIGVDPHKASHTAVAIGRDEDQIASVKVRATTRQVDQLLTWAEPFEKRTWAIESVGGMGYLLAQQLVARGEDVLDVPATLAARIRVLATKRSNKNDPNDAHSIAVAALRAPALRQVEPADPPTMTWSLRWPVASMLPMPRPVTRPRSWCRPDVCLHSIAIHGGTPRFQLGSSATFIRFLGDDATTRPPRSRRADCRPAGDAGADRGG
jgi:hypothetical protein